MFCSNKQHLQKNNKKIMHLDHATTTPFLSQSHLGLGYLLLSVPCRVTSVRTMTPKEILSTDSLKCDFVTFVLPVKTTDPSRCPCRAAQCSFSSMQGNLSKDDDSERNPLYRLLKMQLPDSSFTGRNDRPVTLSLSDC